MTNQPIPLTQEEVAEISELEWIRDSWGAENVDEMVATMADVSAVKFHFVSGCPGYVGDLFLLVGSVLDRGCVVALIRDEEGRLTAFDLD